MSRTGARRITFLALAVLISPAFAETAPVCKGSSTLGTFRILVRRSIGSVALPIKAISSVPAGSLLLWDPVRLNSKKEEDTEVTAIIAPSSGADLLVLEPHKADSQAEWKLAVRPAAIAIVVGPQGFSMGKVRSLVTNNRQLVDQLADYAEQTSKVEGLVQDLSTAEQTGGGIDAVLKGFSAHYGVTLPKLDPKTSTDQQAGVLLKTVLPAAGNYDPLSAKSSQMQQSGGLAASIAGLFFGNAVGLAAGGAMLLQNIKGAVFPGAEFHSAFAQNAERDGLAMCIKAVPAQKARTRVAYLWAYRVPNIKPPVLSMVGPTYLPVGVASTVLLKPAKDSSVKLLEKARDWRLVPAKGDGSEKIPVHVAAAPDSIDVDLAQVKVKPGDYKLMATWDWDPLEIAGTLHLLQLPDFQAVKPAPKSSDLLVEGSGRVTWTLTGADFEFLEKATISKAAPHAAAPSEAHFVLPLGKRAGVQNAVDIEIDTAARGSYRLVLTQSGGSTHQVLFKIFPPHPVFARLPVRVNIGQASQALHLEGKNLAEIEALSSAAGEMAGKASDTEWVGSVRINPRALVGEVFPISLKVKGLESPLTIEGAIKVFGTLPAISEVKKSVPANLGLSLRPDELPAGTPVGLSIAYSRFHDPSGNGVEARPHIELGCKSGGLRKSFRLSPDDHVAGVELSEAASGMLFLSIDPAMVGYPACLLTAAIEIEPEGRSDLFPIGRIVRVPRFDQFTLTNEQIGPAAFAGILKGRDLDVIERTGWDDHNGVRVESVPTPVPGDPVKQTLRVALPWPAPVPHAPLFVWLRGENEGRRTSAVY